MTSQSPEQTIRRAVEQMQESIFRGQADGSHVDQRRWLLEQQATLNQLLANTRPDEPIVRLSFEQRLREVQSQLAKYHDETRPAGAG